MTCVKGDLLFGDRPGVAGTGYMHESFHKDDVAVFTREWFSWADAMYLEVVLKRFKATKKL